MNSIDIKKEQGTYVYVPLVNSNQLREFYKKQGLIVQPDLHCTIACSKKYFNHTINKEEIIVSSIKLKEITTLRDERNVVITFDSPVLQKRFRDCMNEGANYEFESYIPHISLTYDGFKDYKKLRLPNFGLVFDGEKVETLKE